MRGREGERARGREGERVSQIPPSHFPSPTPLAAQRVSLIAWRVRTMWHSLPRPLRELVYALEPSEQLRLAALPLAERADSLSELYLANITCDRSATCSEESIRHRRPSPGPKPKPTSPQAHKPQPHSPSPTAPAPAPQLQPQP